MGDVNPYFWEEMSIRERRQWKLITKGLPEFLLESPVRQEALLDYVRARIEMLNIQGSYDIVLKAAQMDPTDIELTKQVSRWAILLSKKRYEVNQHRSTIGLSTRYESVIRKRNELAEANEDKIEEFPWDDHGQS